MWGGQFWILWGGDNFGFYGGHRAHGGPPVPPPTRENPEKRSVAESVRVGLLFSLGMMLSKQFLLQNSTAPLRCWKWNVLYRIGFWNGPNQVWTLLSEQKLQRNIVLVNNLFKLKGSVANCVTDRTSVHTENASEEFLHLNRTFQKFLFTLYREQLLKRSKNLSGTVWP